MRLTELYLPGAPEAWRECGFAVDEGGACVLGGVTLRLAPEAALRWVVEGLDGAVDGLEPGPPGPAAEPAPHPNGAVAVDHVVAFTPDLDRTVAALEAAGAECRRVRQVPGSEVRQAFFVLGTALLEVGGPIGDPGPARFWGVTLVVEDLDHAAALLGDRLGPAKDAVQPGRRIATVRKEAGLGLPVALMTPR